MDLVRWDDPAADWAVCSLAVIRSCWDYAWRLEELVAWAGSVPRLRSSVELLRWNTDKTYMRDLARAGLPVVPTVWDPAEPADLPDAEEWVVKPSVSAGSRDTARWTDPSQALGPRGRADRRRRTAMVQPYLRSVRVRRRCCSWAAASRTPSARARC